MKEIISKMFLDYVKPIFEFLASSCNKDTVLLMLLASISAYYLGDKLCPNLYSQSQEYIGICLILSLALTGKFVMSFLIKTVKNKFQEHRINRLNSKNKEKILKNLDHLSTQEEAIIRCMVRNDRNNVDYDPKYDSVLHRLYEVGILCNRNIHEKTIFERGYVRWESYKMQDFVWTHAKNNPRFTTYLDDSVPF